jgi:hypothetical protein
MFNEDPKEYLIAFKDFLLAQQAETRDPAAAALITEIDRELLKRVKALAVKNREVGHLEIL